MTDKGYTRDEEKGEKRGKYGTVKNFIKDFCINPVNFQNDISYVGICKCIINIYSWVSKIVEAYVILNVPNYYVISYVIPHNGDNFFERRATVAMITSNMISSIIRYPIQIIPEPCFDAIVVKSTETKKRSISWDDIIKILCGYGF
jgi:hypothetical protein